MAGKSRRNGDSRTENADETTYVEIAKISVPTAEFLRGPPGYKANNYSFFKRIGEVNLEEVIHARRKRVTGNVLLVSMSLWALFQIEDVFVTNWKEDRLFVYRHVTLCLSFSIASIFVTPVLLRYLVIKNCISISVMGIGITNLLYSFPQLWAVELVSVLLGIFKAIFVITMPLYVVKCAKIFKDLSGATHVLIMCFGYNFVFYHMRLVITSLAKVLFAFDPTANVTTWDDECGRFYCPPVMDFETPLSTELHFNMSSTSVLSLIIITCCSFCVIILISLKLDRQDELSESEYAREPPRTDCWEVLKLFARPKSLLLGTLWFCMSYNYEFQTLFETAFIECFINTNIKLYSEMSSNLAAIHASLATSTLVEIFGRDVLFQAALFVQLCARCFLLAFFSESEIYDIPLFLVLSSVFQYTYVVVSLILYSASADWFRNEQVEDWCFVCSVCALATCSGFILTRVICMPSNTYCAMGLSAITWIAYRLLERQEPQKTTVTRMNDDQLHAVESKRSVMLTNSRTEVEELVRGQDNFYLTTTKAYEFLIVQSLNPNEDDEPTKAENPKANRFSFRNWRQARSSRVSTTPPHSRATSR